MSFANLAFKVRRLAGANRWLMFFYFPLLAVAIASTFLIFRNGARIDAALQDDQRTISVATRTGTLAEEVAKSLLLIERSVRDQQPVGSAIFELQRSADRLDQLINCFNDGGEAVAPDGSRFMVKPVADTQALAVLQEVNTIWFGMKSQTDRIIRLVSQKKELTVPIVREASEFVYAQQKRFAEQSLSFAQRIELVQKDEAQGLNRLQSALYLVCVLSWISIPAVFLVRRAQRARDLADAAAHKLGESQHLLEAKARELSQAKSETDRIMETVQEGLLLMDEKAVIGSQFSSELKLILRSEELAGLSLLNLLQRILTEKMFSTTKDYFALLFDARRKEKTVLKVNPLDQVEVHFSNPAGGFISRHLGFSFRRILVGDKVERVFVSIKDITAQIELERSLREAEKKKDRQLEMLLNIIHVEGESLAEFTTVVQTELQVINDSLRAEEFAVTGGQSDLLRTRLKRVFASVHNIKGNASYIKLEYFVKTSADFEAKISELLSKASLSGDDFLSIVVLQAALKADLSELLELQGKLEKLRATVPGRKSAAASFSSETSLVDTLRAFAEKTARDLGKEATLEIEAEVIQSFGGGRRNLLRDVLIQLIRNSLVHSVEDPEIRAHLGKPKRARMTVRRLPKTEAGMVGLAFRDDGQGLDLDRIRSRIVSAALLPAGEAQALDASQLAAYIFEPGFSTAEEVGEHAGRGMGMDIIKTRIVDESGGELLLQSEPGQFCEFGFLLPAAA